MKHDREIPTLNEAAAVVASGSPVVDDGNPPDGTDGLTTRLQLAVMWDGEKDDSESLPLNIVAASAQELGGLLLGLEQTYQVLSRALGYPPHFAKITSITNPELKLDLEGGRDVIDAIKGLVLVLPRFIASLFRPRAALALASLEADAQAAELVSRRKVSEAEGTEAELRLAKAELELNQLRSQMSEMPVEPDPEASAFLRDLAHHLRSASPVHRSFVPETARYLASTRGFRSLARISLAPIESRTAEQRPARRRVIG